VVVNKVFFFLRNSYWRLHRGRRITR